MRRPESATAAFRIAVPCSRPALSRAVGRLGDRLPGALSCVSSAIFGGVRAKARVPVAGGSEVFPPKYRLQDDLNGLVRVADLLAVIVGAEGAEHAPGPSDSGILLGETEIQRPRTGSERTRFSTMMNCDAELLATSGQAPGTRLLRQTCSRPGSVRSLAVSRCPRLTTCLTIRPPAPVFRSAGKAARVVSRRPTDVRLLHRPVLRPGRFFDGSDKPKPASSTRTSSLPKGVDRQSDRLLGPGGVVTSRRSCSRRLRVRLGVSDRVAGLRAVAMT